jgi:hypothetical protein
LPEACGLQAEDHSGCSSGILWAQLLPVNKRHQIQRLPAEAQHRQAHAMNSGNSNPGRNRIRPLSSSVRWNSVFLEVVLQQSESDFLAPDVMTCRMRAVPGVARSAFVDAPFASAQAAGAAGSACG